MGVNEHEKFDSYEQLWKISDDYLSAKKRRSSKALLEDETSREPKKRHDDFTMASSNWMQCSKIHNKKFEMLLEVCERRPEDSKIINDNLVCLEKPFFVGGGSYELPFLFAWLLTLLSGR